MQHPPLTDWPARLTRWLPALAVMGGALAVMAAAAVALSGCSRSAPAPSPQQSSKPQEITLHGNFDDAQAAKLVAAGKVLFNQKSCETCHSLDGGNLVGPPLNGTFGKPVKLKDGSTVTENLDYLYRSLTSPADQVVKGYNAVMPPYDQLSQRSRVALVFYIRSLGRQPTAGAAPGGPGGTGEPGAKQNPSPPKGAKR